MSESPKIFRPGRLVLPNRPAKLNLQHPAYLNGVITAGRGVAAVASPGGGFIDLAGKGQGTKAASMTSKLDGVIGLTTVGNGGTGGFSWTGQATTSVTGGYITAGFIIRTPSSVASAKLLDQTGGSGGLTFGVSATAGSGFIFTGAGGGTAKAFTLSANKAYFLACSLRMSGSSSPIQRWVKVDLETGQIETSAKTTNETLGNIASTLVLTNTTGTASFTGGIAAAMLSYRSFLTMAELIAWAQDPWSFWYPRSTDIASFTIVDQGVADGSASGLGDAIGDGITIIGADGASSGVGDAPGTGAGIFPADGASSGVGDAPSVGAGVIPAGGASAGAGDALGDANTVFPAFGLAPGVASAAADGARVASAYGTAGGTGAANAVVPNIMSAAGNARGIGDASAVGSGFIRWPLSIGFNIDGYGHQRADASVRTEMDSGFDRVRVIDRNPLRTVSASFIIDDLSQLQYLRAWLIYRGKSGEVWFYIDIPVDGEARTVQARVSGEPNYEEIAFHTWKVSLKFVIVDQNVMSRADLDAAVPDDGAFPFSVNPLRPGYSHARLASIAVSSNTEGLARARDRIKPFRRVSLTWWFTADQLQIFHAWHEYRARYDAAFFDIDLPIDGDASTVRARFASQPTISYIAPDTWACGAELLVRDLPMPKDVFGIIEQGGLPDLQAMADAVVDLSLEPVFAEWDMVSGSGGLASGSGSAAAVAA